MTLSAKRAALLALICLGVEFGSARNLSAQSNSLRGSVFRAPVDSFPADATRVAVLLQRDQQGPIVGSATALLR